MRALVYGLAAFLVATPAWADRKVDEAVARAEDQLQKGKGEEALKTVQKLAKDNPTSPEAHVALSRIQYHVGSADALASGQKAAELGASAAPEIKSAVLAWAAEIELAQGKGDQAVTHAEQAVAAQPTATALAALARAQARVGAAGAVATAEKAVAADAKSARAQAALGAALLRAGRAADAEKALRKAVELDPKNALAQARLAEALVENGKAGEAVAIAKTATELDTHLGEAFAIYGLATHAADKTKWNAAIEYAQGGAFVAAKNPEVQLAVGRLFEANNQLAQAVKYYQDAAQADPSFLPARIALLQLRYLRGELDAALVDARALAEAHPKSPVVQLVLGRLLLYKGDYAGSLKALEQAVTLDAATAEGYALQGYALQALRRNDDAVKSFHKATELAPEKLEYRTRYGLLLGLTGKADEGLVELQKVLATPDYKDPAGYAAIGYVYRTQKPPKAEEAIAAYKKALELSPKKGDFALGLGRSYFIANRLDESIDMYKKAVELDPKLAGESSLWLGWAYLFKQDVPQAKASIEKAQAELKNDPRVGLLRKEVEKREAGGAAATPDQAPEGESSPPPSGN